MSFRDTNFRRDTIVSEVRDTRDTPVSRAERAKKNWGFSLRLVQFQLPLLEKEKENRGRPISSSHFIMSPYFTFSFNFVFTRSFRFHLKYIFLDTQCLYIALAELNIQFYRNCN